MIRNFWSASAGYELRPVPVPSIGILDLFTFLICDGRDGWRSVRKTARHKQLCLPRFDDTEQTEAARAGSRQETDDGLQPRKAAKT